MNKLTFEEKQKIQHARKLGRKTIEDGINKYYSKIEKGNYLSDIEEWDYEALLEALDTLNAYLNYSDEDIMFTEEEQLLFDHLSEEYNKTHSNGPVMCNPDSLDF